MKEAGARFCWFKNNPGINNENNEIYFETKTRNGRDGQNKHHRVRRENITVTCEDGDRITGYITHLVEGYQCMEHISVIGLSLSHQSITKSGRRAYSGRS